MNAIESLNWSAPRHGIRTARGVRSLRTANPTPSFWAEWRANKAALQADGITCDKDDAGNWRVLQWMKPDDATALKPVATPASEPRDPDDDEYNNRSEANQPSGVVTEAAAAVFAARPLEVDQSVNWSDEQMAIFKWFNTGKGNLVVQARAGTGKTTTIKQAFAVAPEADMLYAVFNKKNQKEATAKITDVRVDVKTLHGLGFSFIKSVWRDAQPDDKVEYDRIIATAGDVSDDVSGAIEKLVGFAKNLYASPTLGQLEDICRERDIFTDSEDEEAGGWKAEKLARVAIQVMERAKVKDSANRISFNDMVWLPVAMGWARPRYDLVVIDEAQDMNVPQLMMAVKACRKGGRVCVVGDDRQAIYGFRGAAQDGMALMKSKLSASTLGLTVTYRCPKLIVAEAVKLVPDYRAADAAPEGEITDTDQVQMLEQVKVGDAILSRANAPLMSACLQILKKGIPARIEGRDIGRQLVGMVRKLKARSVPDFLARLQRWEDKQLGRLKGLKEVEAKRAAIRDQRETLIAVAEGCANVSEIEQRILSLFQNSDDEGQRPAVVLSSVHKAKGLEFDRVFILNWTFNKRKPKTPEDAQEERNIFYVAITRAKRQLLRVAEGGTPSAVKEQADGTKAGAV
jgi:DNA helicase-2/ATP-dependent DNA helicase PcrA